MLRPRLSQFGGQASVRLGHSTGLSASWVDWDSTQLSEVNCTLLVLDGILELDWGDGPRSGAQAVAFFSDGWCVPEPAGDLARKSMMAVRIAHDTGLDSPTELARWLYAFGRTPPSLSEVRTGRSLRGLLRDSDRTQLEFRYSCCIGGEWEVWVQVKDQAQKSEPPRHKLYVSPSSQSLDEILHRTSELLCEVCVPAFKLVRDRGKATRPDKIIIYFYSAEELNEWASRLANEITGCHGHGVPFTHQINPEATLSRAVDPQFRNPLDKPESWRSWCTGRLGWSLAVAHESNPDALAMPGWMFALFRLSLEGVDISQWKLTV